MRCWTVGRWLLPLCLLVLTTWHVLLIHQETLPHAHTRCPPKIHCPFRQSGKASAAAPASGQNATELAALPSAQDLNDASRDTEGTIADASGAGVSLPYYDLVVMVIGTASPNDQARMTAAEATWLQPQKNSEMTFTYFFALCHDDPGLQCAAGKEGCVRDRRAIVSLPCKHGYKFLASKSIEGYRYIASAFDFRYVLKIDADSLINLACVEQSLRQVPKKCSSFGMGLWRVAGDSKVFGPEHGKYDNTAFREDTGADAYPPYMTGWALMWSADVARFLGMAGDQAKQMPKWRTTWTIDDAAIGTFVLGLDLCRLPMNCPVWTDQEPSAMRTIWTVLSDPSSAIKVEKNGHIEGFSGPFDDDIPGVGDLYNLQAENLGHCASLCKAIGACRSFEYSKTAGKSWNDPIKNCQIATGTNRAGAKWRDYKLYIRTSK